MDFLSRLAFFCLERQTAAQLEKSGIWWNKEYDHQIWKKAAAQRKIIVPSRPQQKEKN